MRNIPKPTNETAMTTGMVPGRRINGTIANRINKRLKPIIGPPLFTPKTGQQCLCCWISDPIFCMSDAIS
jgi:hypothetical protein